MNPERYRLAMALFHLVGLGLCGILIRRWARPERSELPAATWLRHLLAETGVAAVFLYLVAYFGTMAFCDGVGDRPFRPVGEISGRLMGQALFGEAILLAAALAYGYRARRPGRAGVLAACALALIAVYVEAYRIEPFQLAVRQHPLDTSNDAGAPRLRILHLTDIQTPSIGAHEERALRTGMSYRPDLIVMTGDYVQDALGRPTEVRAASDLRALMARVGFQAPLGVFATEGDVGPPCKDVFAGTEVRCVVDENVVVNLPWGETLRITGLSRGRGRERSPQWLARLLSRGPSADHGIVISHSPDFVDALPWSVDLALAGHTHGGQFVLPFFGPIVTASRLPRRYAGGLHDFRGTPLHVSRGVGMERGFAPPVRFLCPPEICVLDVRLPRRTESARVMIRPDERITPQRDRVPEGP